MDGRHHGYYGNVIKRSPSYESNQEYNHQYCLNVGMYTFVIKDLFNDGINGGNYKYLLIIAWLLKDLVLRARSLMLLMLVRWNLQ